MRLRPVIAAAACLLAAAPFSAIAGPASPSTGPLAKGKGQNLKPVAAVPYKGGTDIEFTTIRGRDYAVAPSEKAAGGDGLRIIDITNPEKPRVTGFLECRVSQNDVQVRGDLVLMGIDYDEGASKCYDQLRIQPQAGLMVISIANPARPTAIGFVPIALGVHNSTWHPGGRYVYISDSELVPSAAEPAGHNLGRIQIVDLANPRRPVVIGQLALPPGLSSHDITFNRSGTRAYSAAITQTLILDSSWPATPRIITTILDPAVNISHGADPTPDGRYLLVTDEQSGAAANGVCNVGGVHIYDLRNELVPLKVGYYPFNPANSITATTNSRNLTCTAHVLDYSADGAYFTNAGYAAGVRIVSAHNLTGIPLELGYFTPVDADTWSAKIYKHKNYIFANDMARGLDVYKYDPSVGQIDTRTPAQKNALSFRTTDTSIKAGSYCFTVARDAKNRARAAA